MLGIFTLVALLLGGSVTPHDVANGGPSIVTTRDVLNGGPSVTVPTPSSVAAKRGRSPKTIANTVTVIYRSFNVRNRAELLTELLRRGVIKPA